MIDKAYELMDYPEAEDPQAMFLAALLVVGEPPVFLNNSDNRRVYNELREWYMGNCVIDGEVQEVWHSYAQWLDFWTSYKAWYHFQKDAKQHGYTD